MNKQLRQRLEESTHFLEIPCIPSSTILLTSGSTTFHLKERKETNRYKMICKVYSRALFLFIHLSLILSSSTPLWCSTSLITELFPCLQYESLSYLLGGLSVGSLLPFLLSFVFFPHLIISTHKSVKLFEDNSRSIIHSKASDVPFTLLCLCLTDLRQLSSTNLEGTSSSSHSSIFFYTLIFVVMSERNRALQIRWFLPGRTLLIFAHWPEYDYFVTLVYHSITIPFPNILTA